ncbi:hypothetical protein DFH09DRAFT_1197523 [Mycena vulgaris]|nr:hypothetical protein DFH09DRAFT_1197523 [Mycena vulgaris]
MSLELDGILGALLVGTWANSAAYYYRHFKHDNWKLKLLVTSAVAIDFVSMIANYASVYLYTITHWGGLAYLENQYWPLPLYIFSTSTVASLAQGFLAFRYWRLSIRLELTWECRAWFIAEAVADISIALALLLEFRKIKPSFKETRSLFNRLVARTIQTGVVGATMALAILVAQTGNTRSSMGTSSGANSGTRGEHRKQAQSEGGDSKGGIRGFLVHMDPPQNVYSMGSFKTNPGQGLPDDSPADEIEMTVNDSASYSSKKKQDLFSA